MLAQETSDKLCLSSLLSSSRPIPPLLSPPSRLSNFIPVEYRAPPASIPVHGRNGTKCPTITVHFIPLSGICCLLLESLRVRKRDPRCKLLHPPPSPPFAAHRSGKVVNRVACNASNWTSMDALISLTFYKLSVTTRVTRVYFIADVGEYLQDHRGFDRVRASATIKGNEFAMTVPNGKLRKNYIGIGNAIHGNSIRNFGVVYILWG